MPLDFPSLKDTRTILRIYATLTGIGGLIVTGWGPMWFTKDLPGVPWGLSALVRIVGALMIATGCWAATLSQVVDPELRRKGVQWFAAGHCILLLVVRLQLSAIWGADLASGVQAFLSPEFLVVMFLLMHSESSFRNRDGLPVDALERLRSGYEQQIREAGAQEERNRLARDLHDSIKQQIFVIQTAAATAQTRFDDDRTGAAVALDQIRDAARDAMKEMEVMMDQLRAVPLENASLVEALKKQCEALGYRTGAHVEFRLGELPPNQALAPGAYQAILRVAQEACANIGRHARAHNVHVSFGEVGKRLDLRIEDDGAGFDPLRGQRGMGIANMRARAEEFGGRFELISRKGGGTAIVFSLPCMNGLNVAYRKTMIRQMLIFTAMFAIVILYVEPRFRPFGYLAWGSAGAWRVLVYWRTWNKRLS